ncbi:hypothetical protein P9705_001267 [Enterococcus faecalis]|nr:hypothetical protein [Enterococcus faecalis]
MAESINKQKLVDLLEKTFNPNEFCEFFKLNNENKLAEIVNEALREEGYPPNANYINIDFSLRCKNVRDFEDWATIAIEGYIDNTDKTSENEAIREFFSRGNDMYMYNNHLEGLQVNVKFAVSPEEYMKLVPNVRTISDELEKAWQPSLIERKMSRDGYEPVETRLRELLDEAGFENYNSVDLKTITYSITVKNILDFDSWAQIAIERYVYGSLDRFLQVEMFEMYLENPQYLEIDVELETTKDEWEQEN